MWFGGNIRAKFRRIENSIPDAPSRRKRRRSGGKRWNIHLRPTPRRLRFRDDPWAGVRVLLLVMIGMGVLTYWGITIWSIR